MRLLLAEIPASLRERRLAWVGWPLSDNGVLTGF